MEETSIRTLHLWNTPARPESKDQYARMILKHINPNNKYVLNTSLPFPLISINIPNKIEPIDESLGIVAISVSSKKDIKNQCFITFDSNDSAKAFLDGYGEKWKVGGRVVKMDFAKKDSLIGLHLRSNTILKKALKSRRLSKILQYDENLKHEKKLNRKLRRLRQILRKKGLEEAEISKIVENVKEEQIKLKGEVESKPASTAELDFETKITKKELIDLSVNPANNILLVQNLPNGTTEVQLKELFAQTGLKEVRLVSVRNLAFIEYSNIQNATEIKNKLGTSYNWHDKTISIAFAK
ncbi:hypothetical protein Kpol_1039p50 [Vanderwaltozyma polyspora DSM 70294]|uniref:RRM domain-containing protein n=1 Tax=Vanderwaltozyma polyspora (strain ATCC 22028 / DSM 70294 / BCRC 21397 / CBS 2163 / NBRC 10782 / NRRL Y-8283 / UCD 57-17) TaxID=436907 RepID=A7THH5_VANPO|nr:uncharacterized protein Kpol_1039p50 [Vanderwaltozyma polyspora DSM 70294]EDO18299.1 hypothetical protein Kpol_1039p50 [Vanderwaltozyma polyspora DSM 70294]